MDILSFDLFWVELYHGKQKHEKRFYMVLACHQQLSGLDAEWACMISLV